MILARDPKRQALLQFLFGGLLPVIAFTVIEEKFGIIWGVVAGMVFSVGEMTWEWIRSRRISFVTLVTSFLILGLGAVSLFAKDGIWFKLQPALMEGGLAIFLFASFLLEKPFLLAVMEKQNQNVPVVLKEKLPGLTVRMAIFFGLHAALATWAAFSWSTSAWALLKGVGFTGSLLVYMAVEILVLRRRLQAKASAP